MIRYIGHSTWEIGDTGIEIKVPSSKVTDTLNTALQFEGYYLLTEKEIKKFSALEDTITSLENEIKTLEYEIENMNEND